MNDKTVSPAAEPIEDSGQRSASRSSQTEPDMSVAGPMPVVRENFEKVNRPLILAQAAQKEPIQSSSVTVVKKESLPTVADSPKQNLSALVSRLSSVIRPSGNSVTNTSNNLSAPVTINVNANGSNAEQIGETIYNTAERYLIRTLKGAFQ